MSAFWIIVFVVLGLLLIAGLIQNAKDSETLRTGTPEQRAEVLNRQATLKNGPLPLLSARTAR